MTAPNCLYLIVMFLAVMGWEVSACAENDVTVISTPAATTAPAQQTLAPDGTPVVHKSLHKKKQNTTATAQTQSFAPTNTASVRTTLVSNFVPSVSSLPVYPTASGPTVETGLPVARYPGMGVPIKGVSTYLPTTVTLPAGKSVAGATTHQPYFASILPVSAGSFSSPSRTTSSSPDFVFTNYGRKTKAAYPWKMGIITTMFWIGEGGSNISSTDNIGSAWDEHWRSTNRGNDSPYNRSGYAPADHAPTVNTFYVALPFNDLAFPDKASEWVPRAWHRRPEDGKQVSACKDRWVEIKNAQGRVCFAQWEDVGPLRYDHAEYVFGDERPIGMGDNHAGLDVSPAVWQYLGLDEKNRAITSWRFVDDEDVLPGAWLRYDELALLYQAMHQQKNSSPSSDLPIQRSAEPIDDPENIKSNKQKVDQSMG